jgi:glycerophosphoryl diester phosphodiesterase
MTGTTPVYIVGHRGARGEAPENTIASFQRAIDAGVREIELDVRLSSDGHLIVLHDKELDRTTWHSGPAQHLSLADLGLVDARRNTPGWHSPLGVPSLAEVIDLCPGDMRFQFEVKALERRYQHHLAQALKQMIMERQMRERCVVTSSHTGFLQKMRDVAPDIRRGLVAQYRFQQPLRKAQQLGCRWLMAHYSLVNKRLMKSARRRDIRVSVWTVNDLMEAERLQRLKVESVITDFPTRFCQHFGNRSKLAALNPFQSGNRKSRISDSRSRASL